MKAQIIGLALGVLLAVSGTSADAGNARASRKLIESSLRVGGTIVVAPDGTVQSYTLEHTEMLGAPLENFLKNNITHWKFKPVEVDGKVVTAKAAMSLQLIANREEAGSMSVRIANTWFGANASGTGTEEPATDNPRSLSMRPPKYPNEAAYMGGQGITYLVVNIGRDGKVLAVEAERVNLRSLGTDTQMNMLRKAFADASIRAAKQWTFQPPTTGPEAAKDSWRVRVPVDFRLAGLPGVTQPKPGGWESYIPDPTVRDVPWARDELRAAGSPDALPGNGVYSLRQGLQLLNPPTT
jgi:hypothetical protein